MNAAAHIADDDDVVGLRTMKSAQRFLGVSKSQIYRLCDSGELELVKIGPRGTRVTQASLDAYVAALKRFTPHRRK
jgi:excisionase family DNA binding protein